MTARLVDGNAIAGEILGDVRRDAAALAADGRPPRLAALLVGHAASSEVYIRTQRKACEESGIGFELRALESSATEADALAAVRALNRESGVTGIILHQPFPPHIDERRIREALDPARDVESMTPHNFGRLVMGQFEIAPSTASAALEIAHREHPDMTGLEVTIVGHSEIVGKPLSLLLLRTPRSSPTVTVCHIATRDLAFHTRRADLIFVAAGVPGLLRAEMVRPGATVIDIGINRVRGPGGKSRIVGDAAPDVASVAGALTPVPGGVGPVTVAVLLRNTVRLAKGTGRA